MYLFGGWIIGGLVCGFLCGYVASEKRRSGGAWFVAGFLLNVLALIALAAIPSLTKDELEQRESESRGDDDEELQEWRRKMKEPQK